MVLLGGVSAISAASDNALDNLTSEMNTMDDSISVSNDENVVSVDDSALNTLEKKGEFNEQSSDATSMGILGLQSGAIALQNLGDSNNQPIQEVNLENSFEEEDSYILYVGINKTDDGGNGSIENPYGSLELASNNIHGENKVQLNIYDGIYYVGADLKFNTSNLYINAINNNVVLKNLYNAGGYNQYIGLTSVNANCTISNIIFDASDYTINGFIQGNPTAVANTFFAPFYGGANLVVFNNCSFN